MRNAPTDAAWSFFTAVQEQLVEAVAHAHGTDVFVIDGCDAAYAELSV